jgi:hypothetical protein
MFILELIRDTYDKMFDNLCLKPGTVIERSKACTVFARSEAGIVSSNPAQDMDV